MSTIYLYYHDNYRPMNDRECLVLPETLSRLLSATDDDQHINIGNSLAIDAVRAAICEEKLPHDRIALWYNSELVWFNEDGRTEGNLPEPVTPLLCILIDGNARMNAKRKEQHEAIQAERAPKFKKIQESIQFDTMRRWNG